MANVIKHFVPAGRGIRCQKKYDKLIPEGVCWHYTGNFKPTANADAHASLWTRVDIGAHYVLDKNKIIWCAPHDEVVWHAGPGNQYTSFILNKFPRGANSSLIGVECCICDGWEAIYDNAVALGVELCQQYNWDPHKHFFRHYDCTKKQCPMYWTDSYPGGNMAWKKFKNDVVSALTPYNGPFKDMENHWAESMVTVLFKLGMISGTGAGIFSPNKELNRAEAAVMVIRILDKIKKQVPDKNIVHFKDIPHPDCKWATDVINKATAKGIINGYQDNTFKPMVFASRAEFAVIIANLLKAVGILVPKGRNIYSDTISHWAGEDVNGLAELGILAKGKNFNPKARLTRAEMAVIVYRVLKLFKEV